MLDIGLKKEIAKQKAEEERAKRNQQIMSSIKVDVPKVNLHLLPEAQKLFTNATSELTQAAMKGDTFGKAQIEGKYNMLFNNLALQSQAIDKFLSSETQGFIVPQEVKVAFSMPKEEGQAYLKDLLNKKPEYRTLVDVNEYGDYAFNSVKNRNLSDDFNTIIGKNERLFEATGKKIRNNVTRDENELYKIPASRIEEFSTQLAVDPEFRANVILKDRATYDKIMSDAAKANPNLRPEEVEQVALRKYAFDRLENINQKTVKSNIPQLKGDFNLNLGGGLKTSNGWLVTKGEFQKGSRVRQYEPELQKRLDARNEAIREYNKNKPLTAPLKKELTYDQAYGQTKNDYDEIYFENKDVSENKTFKIPNKQGGNIDMIPLSIRRKKGEDSWELVGKEVSKNGTKTSEKDVSVSLTPDVIGKLDAILGASTVSIINDLYGSVPKQIPVQSPKPQQPKTTQSSGGVYWSQKVKGPK
jgi:hypothetical protein